MTEIADLIIREHDLTQLDHALQTMLRDSRARCVILINRDDGSVLAAQGYVDSLDTTSLGALAAGAFASAREIARLIGEPEFSVLFHQGEREHVHVNLAGTHGLLMTLFNDTTTVGLVRLCARRACAIITRVLAESQP
jgi:predicted regulator of Ras-like GTPase activity (Roadblock/LC7/MglB family)